jgi:hypothetical protein
MEGWVGGWCLTVDHHSRSSSAPCTHIQWNPNTSGGVHIIPASAVLLLDGEVVKVETGTGATSSTVATLQFSISELNELLQREVLLQEQQQQQQQQARPAAQSLPCNSASASSMSCCSGRCCCRSSSSSSSSRLAVTLKCEHHQASPTKTATLVCAC